MTDAVLVLNAGSSTLKFGLFGADIPHPRPLLRGLVEMADERPSLVVRDPAGTVLERREWGAVPEFEAVVADILDRTETHLGAGGLAAVGHRVVHGRDRTEPARVSPQLLDELEALTPLAPLHQPHNLAAIRAVAARRPDLPQVASFDTAFHSTMPDLATRFALPEALHARGIRRYGFHGLSYAWLARRLAELDPKGAGGRWVLMHLGAGASLCALKDGTSRDTTMGFTALDGLVMGTRCGSLDPGVVLQLIRDGIAPDEVEDILSRQSGLLGVSGLSSDMRVLAQSENPAARRAIDLFVRRILRETGALTAMLGGLDGVVFSGGIGEHSATVRAAVADGLGWLGARLDRTANADGRGDIAVGDSAVALRVIPTDEEAMIAEETVGLRG